jgi:XXXCH domain-containing protein
MSSETRIERIILRESLPDFFRELAHMFENGGGNGMESIAEFRKMKISIEESSGRIAVQIKFKGAEPAAEHHPEVKTEEKAPRKPLKYKDLKKRMKRSFKAIFTMVHENRMPDREVVEEFLRQSELMVSYPGYGDEYYTEYREACDAFTAAFLQGDMKALHQAFDRIDQAKSHCHNRYK